MTDIVERLYKEAEDPKERIFLPRDCFLFGEAATEIERLRAEVEALRHQRDMVTRALREIAPYTYPTPERAMMLGEALAVVKDVKC